MCLKTLMKGSIFSAPPLGLMKTRPMTTLHILHICMCLVTQNDTYMTQNNSVMICGMIVTMKVSFPYSYYIHYSNDTVNVLFYQSFVLSAFSVCLTVPVVL